MLLGNCADAAGEKPCPPACTLPWELSSERQAFIDLFLLRFCGQTFFLFSCITKTVTKPCVVGPQTFNDPTPILSPVDISNHPCPRFSSPGSSLLMLLDTCCSQHRGLKSSPFRNVSWCPAPGAQDGLQTALRSCLLGVGVPVQASC